MQQYTVFTLHDYDEYLSTIEAESPEQALIQHAVTTGHIDLTPDITTTTIGDTLQEYEVDYLVCLGSALLSSMST